MRAADVVDRMGQHRAVAIVRAPERDQAELAMAAAIDAGFRICEFTLSVPGALELVRAFRSPGLTIGVGTVLSPDQVGSALEAGADFIVAPVFDRELVRLSRSLDVAILPGCATPTELWEAHRAGAPLQKLFPAPSPAWLATVLAPLPMLRVVPTSGVDVGNAKAWLDAGAHAVGFVRSLFEPAWLARRDAAAIRERAAEALAAVGQRVEEAASRSGTAGSWAGSRIAP